MVVRFNSPREGEPRVHSLPYSRPLHKNIAKAQRALRKGRRVVGRLGKIPNRSQTRGPNARGKAGRSRGAPTNYLYDADFWYEMPAGRGGRKPTGRE